MNVLDLPSPFRLAGLIAAHEGQTVQGRLRLQKTVYLLQQAGVPLGYDFKMLHYGPYSEGLRAEARILTNLGLVEEDGQDVPIGTRYSLRAAAQAEELMPVVEQLGASDRLRVIEAADTDTLELAATYRYYRELGYEAGDAVRALENKKRDKFSNASVLKAMRLLEELRIPA